MNSITLSTGKEISKDRLDAFGLKPKKSISEILAEHKVQNIHVSVPVSTNKEPMDKVLLVLLDCSGSMESTMGSKTKMTVAWDVLQKTLMPNMAGLNYGVILFGGSYFDNRVTWGVHPCSNTNALVVMRPPQPDGGTPMLEALDMAWDWVKQNVNLARFILISDGCPNEPTKTILQFAKDNKTIPIDTVGIGSYERFDGPFGRMSSEYDREFLMELSRITGGIFTEAKNAKQLATTIQQLSPAQRLLLGTVKKEK